MASDQKTAEKPRASTDDPLAISLLVEDHRAVEKLFNEYEGAAKARKAEIVEEACLRLTIHTQIEEEIFYPAVRGKVEDEEVDEALVEHQAAEQLIGELQEMSPGDDLYDAKFKVLGEQVMHHVEEEEEGMFIEAKKSDLDLDAIGKKLAARKEELAAELAEKGEVDEG